MEHLIDWNEGEDESVHSHICITQKAYDGQITRSTWLNVDIIKGPDDSWIAKHEVVSTNGDRHFSPSYECGQSKTLKLWGIKPKISDMTTQTGKDRAMKSARSVLVGIIEDLKLDGIIS